MSDVFRKEVAIEVSNRSPKPGAFSLVISHLGWGSNVASELSGLARDEADPISVPLGRRAFSGLKNSSLLSRKALSPVVKIAFSSETPLSQKPKYRTECDVQQMLRQAYKLLKNATMPRKPPKNPLLVVVGATGTGKSQVRYIPRLYHLFSKIINSLQ
jgi:hypothetical protein